MNSNFDEQMMRRALQLARYGAGHVSPNPMVGAVIVDDRGVIVGEGWHRAYGGAHAEVNAVASVTDHSLLRGATIYVTLEPCSHYGKTPPCARLLVKCGFGRVVVGCVDPNPLVSGRGISMLREAGIMVDVGVLQAESEQLNRRFMYAHRTGLPWVQLKWAQTVDGRMAAPTGEPRLMISTPFTTVLMHRQRAMCDAIIIGAGTARVDNPTLTVRHAPGRDPLRVIIAHDPESLPPHLNVLTDGRPTLVLNGEVDRCSRSVTWQRVDLNNPREWLQQLYEKYGCTSVMVEGGMTMLRQFSDAGLYNEARVEVS